MNFLLVNDDGLDAQGINDLKSILVKFGTVYVVAPMEQQSGKSCSLSIKKEKNFIKLDDYTYRYEGTPTDCVNFAFRNLKLPIDIVVSGCNHGLNHSIYSYYSGTIGACIQATVFGVPSIAFSAHFNNMEHVLMYSEIILKTILDNKLYGRDYITSVNMPYTKEVKGIRFGNWSINNNSIDIGDETVLCSDSNNGHNFIDKESDLHYAVNGYISICPLKTSFAFEEKTKEFKEKVGKIDF